MIVMRSVGGRISCKDCGNQAKKDCIHHMRCRTCCKYRELECPTHVKSTWVPSASRRRHHHLSSFQQQNQEEEDEERRMVTTTTSKRLRQNQPSTFITNNAFGLEVGSFPVEVNSEAVFRCVRVSTIDEAQELYAYQTTVNIGGHVFKGILYDQGPGSQYFPGESSLLGGGGGGGDSSGCNLYPAIPSSVHSPPSAAAALLDPCTVYPTPFNAFMAGTQFFPHSRS